MALTRKMLKAMGIGEEQIEQIIDAHTESTDALKEERDRYKKDADKLPDVQKELDDLKKAEGDGGYKDKYEKEHEEYESYKRQVAEEKESALKKDLYKSMLEGIKIDPKYIPKIMQVTDFSNMKIKDGKLEGEEELTNSAKTEWSQFATNTETKGAEVDNPPGGGDGGKPDLGSMSMEDYIAARKKM